MINDGDTLMARKKKPEEVINDNYWKAQTDIQVRDEYNRYLEEKGVISSPHYAHLFAMEKTSNDFQKYHGYDQRQLIIFLAGELPYMYD